jgi:hypothetical protein
MLLASRRVAPTTGRNIPVGIFERANQADFFGANSDPGTLQKDDVVERHSCPVSALPTVSAII